MNTVILNLQSFHPEIEFDSKTKSAMLDYFKDYAVPITSQAMEACISSLKSDGKLTIKTGAKIDAQDVRFTDAGGNPRPYTEVPTQPHALTAAAKAQLAEKVRSMTSAELMNECRKDPAFKQAVDEMK
jgi:hypothetical protein